MREHVCFHVRRHTKRKQDVLCTKGCAFDSGILHSNGVFSIERSSLQRAGRRETASLHKGNIPERASIIQSIGQPDDTADRYSPLLPERATTLMAVLTTLD